MKKIVIISLFVALALPVMAQHEGKHHRSGKHMEITELVSDLNAKQKQKIESISNSSRERVDILRKQQHAVRDSIALFMEREGDQSKQLFPLFDREARLQAAVSREMYVTKIRIDEVLTKEQRTALRQTLAKERERKRN